MSFSQWLRATCGLAAASNPRVKISGNRRSRFELLESRSMLSASSVTSTASTPVSSLLYSVDGTGNNLTHTLWGSDGVDLLRTAPAAYADGLSAPVTGTGGATSRPSAREISNVLVSQSGDLLNARDMSNFVYAWGQFIDHDLDLTTTGLEGFDIAVPKGDPEFDPGSTGTQVISLDRSTFDPSTGTTDARQQTNTITAYLDGSMVYASDTIRAAALRTMSGGHLKTSDDDLLSLNTEGLPNANDTMRLPADELFLAGDVRANENIELTSLQILFMREHNRIADQLAAAHPTWTDEQLFQAARKTVIAEIQSITFNEFLPALLGSDAPGHYSGYNANVNPGIANEFSTAAFRFGHSMLGDDVEFLDNQGNPTQPAIALSQAFFSPDIIEQTGIDPILKYLASDRAQEVDVHVVDSLRNFLFGQPGDGGLDLASLNIQRGRDNGLADYNTTRAAYGLPKVKTFADITSNVTLQQELKQLYGNVNNIDLWVGGLAEDHLPGASMGATFTRIIADQFSRIRAGDRLWFERTFSGSDLQMLEHTTLADIVERNSGVTNIQDNVFFFKASITGRVFSDTNGNGRDNIFDPGIAARVIQLLAADGTVVATTTTDRFGFYRFDHLDLGSYTVEEVMPSGTTQVGPASYSVQITRGMNVVGKDFGEVAKRGSKPIGNPCTALGTDLAAIFAWYADDGTDALAPPGHGN